MSGMDVTPTNQTVNVNQAPSSIRAVSRTQRIVVNRGGETLNRVGTTQQIVVNRGDSSVEVVSTPQRLVVNSPGSSVGIVNAGPPGPRGPMGPADLSVYLTEDGQLLTRASGDLAPITRPNLAADPAFTAAYAAAIAGHVALADPHIGYVLEAELAAHVAAADPHPVYLTATEGNAAYVNVGGDTMTGPLTGTSIVMSGNVGSASHTLSFGGEALKFSTINGYAAWFSGATRTGYLQGHSSGMILHSEIGTLQLLGASSFNAAPSAPGFTITGSNSLYWPSYVGGWFMQDTTWIRSHSGKSVYIDQGVFGGGYVSINNGGSLISGYRFHLAGSGYVTDNLIVNSQCQGNRNQIADAGWGNASFLANPGTGGAAIAFHAGGTAPQIRIASGSNYFYFRDAGGISYVPLAASAFDVSSARATKQDISPWPPNPKNLGAGANPDRPTKRLRDLHPVSFRRKEEDAMAEVPSDEKEQKDTTKYRIHRCHNDTCGGSEASPCARRLNWERGEIGFVAEEVAEFLPEAVMFNNDGNPEAISVMPLLTAVLAAVQELDSRVDLLEGAM